MSELAEANRQIQIANETILKAKQIISKLKSENRELNKFVLISEELKTFGFNSSSLEILNEESYLYIFLFQNHCFYMVGEPHVIQKLPVLYKSIQKVIKEVHTLQDAKTYLISKGCTLHSSSAEIDPDDLKKL